MNFPKSSEHYINSNDITLHYIEYPHNGATIICLHGLTANCHAFDGLVANGLNDTYRLIAPDLRGRGLSSHPAFGYSLEEHAQDILGLLDHLKIEQAILMGHSFGGLLSCYLAATYPDRVKNIILLDAAAEMNPDVMEMLGPAIGRLEQKFDSWDTYLTSRKNAPYMIAWDDTMLSYYEADVMKTEDGGVTPSASLANIVEAALGLSHIPWNIHMAKIDCPVVLMNALSEYTMEQPLLPEYQALQTVEIIPNCKYIAVEGNHHTMLYGLGAKQIVKAVHDFLD